MGFRLASTSGFVDGGFASRGSGGDGGAVRLEARVISREIRITC